MCSYTGSFDTKLARQKSFPLYKGLHVRSRNRDRQQSRSIKALHVYLGSNQEGQSWAGTKTRDIQGYKYTNEKNCPEKMWVRWWMGERAWWWVTWKRVRNSSPHHLSVPKQNLLPKLCKTLRFRKKRGNKQWTSNRVGKTEQLVECKSIFSMGIHLKMQIELGDVIVVHYLWDVMAAGGASWQLETCQYCACF